MKVYRKQADGDWICITDQCAYSEAGDDHANAITLGKYEGENENRSIVLDHQATFVNERYERVIDEDPEEPESPQNPDTPGDSNTPGNPETPGNSGTSGNSGTPEKPVLIKNTVVPLDSSVLGAERVPERESAAEVLGENRPQTGDDTSVWGLVAAALACVGILGIYVRKRKKLPLLTTEARDASSPPIPFQPSGIAANSMAPPSASGVFML